jgi:hypothetical protein
MFQNFLLKQMLKRQMKGIPESEQDKVFSMIEKNPDFFTKIATEVQEKTKGGMSQQDAMMTVMKNHQDKIKAIMGN